MSKLWRRLWAWLAALVIAVALPLAGAPIAAAAEDSVDSWHVNFTIQADGAVQVREEIVWRFGEPDRHGIYRLLVTREPHDAQHDRVYAIHDIKVHSPDAPDRFRLSDKGVGRKRDLEIRIGDEDVKVKGPTATYVIEYRMTGALRSFADHDELYWNALTPRDPFVKDVQFTVTAPGGLTMANCFVGAQGSTTSCDSATVQADGSGQYMHADKGADQYVTLGAHFAKGTVANATPQLEPKANATVEWLKRFGILAGIIGVLHFGLKWLNKLLLMGSGDYEFVDVAPGNIPPDPASAPTRRTQRRSSTTVPVRFNPPDLPIGVMAGLDTDQELEDFSAVLLSMAVKGVIGLRATKTESKVYTKLIDPTKVEYDYEKFIVDELYSRYGYAEFELSDEDEKIPEVAAKFAKQIKNDAIQADLLLAKKGVPWAVVIHIALALLVMAVASPFLPDWEIGILVIFPFFAGSMYVGQKWRNYATATGMAYWYQFKGFKEYLKTAEADQLRFEEGEDIFSKYLPWAVLAGQTKKFTELCRQLIDQGRLPASTPGWYYGDNFSLDLRWDTITRTISNSGDSSSSSDGGSAGGGGGGGGSGSW